jgi:hypothetical protein
LAEHVGQPLLIQVDAVAWNIFTRAQRTWSHPFADHMNADLRSAPGKPQLVVHEPSIPSVEFDCIAADHPHRIRTSNIMIYVVS